MKFVHAADLHLDSPLRGLPSYDGAPTERVREATRRAFANLIDLCLREAAAFLVLAGDVFDGDWKDFSTGLYFVRQLERLRAPGIPVFIVRGNHDARSEVTRQLRLPPHVHEFSQDSAETVVLDGAGVAVHGLSFGQREVPASLVPRYPPPRDGLFNVGVLHTSAEGRPGHDPYAPCSVDELVAKGYEYWALGHVHKHEILHERPWIVFSGNLQGRHVRETGPKGAVVVSVDGAEVRLRHQPLDVVRWQVGTVELAAGDDVEALYTRARALFAATRAEADGRLAALRLLVRGATQAHAALAAEPARIESELRALAFEWGDELWLEEVQLHTRPPLDLDELRRSEGFLGELLRAAAAARQEAQAAPQSATALAPHLAALAGRLSEELARAGLELGDAATLAELIDDAEALLAARLT